MKLSVIFLLVCTLCLSCGYRFEQQELENGEAISLSVPFVKGDLDGQLTNALIKEMSKTGSFRFVREGARHNLVVAIVEDEKHKIGFRYDRIPNPTPEELAKNDGREKNIVPTEGRRILTAQVTVEDTRSGKVVLGPTFVKAFMEYDYVNSDNLVDLTFLGPDNQRLTVLNYSLGQLDSIEGAEDNALDPLYRHMAQKIIDGLLGQKWWDNDKP